MDIFDGARRGYLLEDYRLFHLRDELAQEMDYHYHAFEKIVFHLAGRVTYSVEGKRYELKPYDILLVGRNLLHRPIIGQGEPYERIILWLSAEYLSGAGRGDCDLGACFRLTEERGFHMLRPRGEDRLRYRRMFEQMEEAQGEEAFGSATLEECCLWRLLVSLNRDILAQPEAGSDVEYRFDPKMEEVTRFIGDHLSEELPIERQAGEFYLSWYYLMHRFKEVYGVTVHQYIRQKRLLRAADELRRGTPVLKAAMEAGFNDYSAFLRAFQAAYGKSPREWK